MCIIYMLDANYISLELINLLFLFTVHYALRNEKSGVSLNNYCTPLPKLISNKVTTMQLILSRQGFLFIATNSLTSVC